MTKYAEQYSRAVRALLEQIEGEERSIHDAAKLMSETIVRDELIHVIGTGGHSNIGTYEMFNRAGGLGPVNGILDPGTLLSMGALRSTRIERTPGYAPAVLDAFNVTGGVLIIINAYGINAMTIDTAVEGRRRKIPTIGVTSRSFGDNIPADHPARHPSGKNLYQLVDVFVDCHMPLGDAVVEFENVAPRVAPVSTLVLSYTLNLMVIETVRLLKEQGFEPPIWTSGNMPGGQEAGRKLVEKYRSRIRLL
ncbi:MAG: sugar isomerase domain-containing protein [Spirochaetia bacterium]|jgi:uncharacterized phosphosugar-binding protein